MIQFGYACLALGVEDTQIQSCIMRNASKDRLREIIAHNLDALKGLIEYNAENHFHLFRISSDLIPFGSSPVNTLEWPKEFARKFEEIGGVLQKTAQRVSLHPGQYTVINSPDEDVVNRAIADLEYHEKILHSLNTDSSNKIILHVGGAYGDKTAAIERFCRNWDRLSDRVRSRIVLENDERIFNISDVLQISRLLGIPAVFDVFHHSILAPDEPLSMVDWLIQCTGTWKPSDGKPKIHYSQQFPGGKPGAHSKNIYAEEFLDFYKTIQHLDLDVMLEVKDKNISVKKCELLTSSKNDKTALEQEWEKYKFSVLEHSEEAYESICTPIKNEAISAEQFYSILEPTLEKPVKPENGAIALLGIWEDLKEQVQLTEARRFFSLLNQYRNGTGKLSTVKNHLLKLARKYHEPNILQSYYFL